MATTNTWTFAMGVGADVGGAGMPGTFLPPPPLAQPDMKMAASNHAAHPQDRSRRISTLQAYLHARCKGK
ncbi:MAG TPA: hypothetical protein VKF82_07110 [Candidatus Eremiobacteraceae bacterium]|nr:hypothetical protein [Candidatus Eremiobacteraceae bacterium]